jgi:hypothetical protein
MSYPRLWNRGIALGARTQDLHDADCIAAWLSRAARDGSLGAFLVPGLTPEEKAIAAAPLWILGVPGRSGRH